MSRSTDLCPNPIAFENIDVVIGCFEEEIKMTASKKVTDNVWTDVGNFRNNLLINNAYFFMLV